MFIYGDITRGQCQRAVDIANEYLETPIGLPARCCVERFFERISKLPLTEIEQFKVFEEFFLGTKDAEFGENIRQIYSEEVFDNYWKERFTSFKIGSGGFGECFSDYLLWGFDLEKMCSLINFETEEEPKYKKFVLEIMNAKLHKKEKNCKDALKIDQEEQGTYSIYTLLAQFCFGAARNKKIDRYIPIDDIRCALKNAIGIHCDVDGIIDEYIENEKKEKAIDVSKMQPDSEEFKDACEQDPSEVFNQITQNKAVQLQENREKYDIAEAKFAKYFEEGDSIEPRLLEYAKNVYAFGEKELLVEEDYLELMGKTPKERLAWFHNHYRKFLLLQEHWEKIYSDILKNKESFARYYVIMRLHINSEDLKELLIAFLVNDEFYEYINQIRQSEKASENNEKIE